MSQNSALLASLISKGKTPKDVTGALNDLLDLMAFHQRVSVAMGMSLQHLADSLFVHLSNLILLRRDLYLDFVKNGVKQDTMNLLRNAPLFGYGLFPDAAIVLAEQDIQKHETSSVAQRPGPGTPQHTCWRGTTGIVLMSTEIEKPLLPLIKLHSNSISLGGNSVGVAPGVVDADKVPTLVSPSLNNTSPTNDNYYVGPTPIQVNQCQLDLPKVQNGMCPSAEMSDKLVSRKINPVVTQTLKLDVSCRAVTHALIVPLHGLPQRKGESPNQSVNKIKHVKGVCCYKSFGKFGKKWVQILG